MMIMMTAD